MPKKGFTLVELLIVVAIIGVLSVVGLTAYSGVQQKARDTKRRADIDAIAKVMESKYDVKTAAYPTDFSSLNASFANSQLPIPPRDNDYIIGTDNKSFVTCTKLENASNDLSYLQQCLDDLAVGVANQNCYCRKSSSGSTQNSVALAAAGSSATPGVSTVILDKTGVSSDTFSRTDTCSTITAWKTNSVTAITGCGITTSALTSLGLSTDGSADIFVDCPVRGNWDPINTLNYCNQSNSNSYIRGITIYSAYQGGSSLTDATVGIYGRGTADYPFSTPVNIRLRFIPPSCYNVPQLNNSGSIVCDANSYDSSTSTYDITGIPDTVYINCPSSGEQRYTLLYSCPGSTTYHQEICQTDDFNIYDSAGTSLGNATLGNRTSCNSNLTHKSVNVKLKSN